jgi:hypothetical protein
MPGGPGGGGSTAGNGACVSTREPARKWCLDRYLVRIFLLHLEWITTILSGLHI